MQKWYFIVKTIGTEKDMRTSGFYRYTIYYTAILTEGRNFKTFSKKVIQLFRTVATYLLQKMLNMELGMLMVLVEFAYIRHS